MYRYNVYRPKSWFWIENEEEIRALAEDVNKAIEIVRKVWPHYSYSVGPVFVSGGCHERDTGYEMFSGGVYPIKKHSTGQSWEDLLVEDFNKEKEALDGWWYNTLNFDKISVHIDSPRGPIMLEFYRGEMLVTICYDEDEKDKERELLAEFEREFGAVS